MYSWHTSLYPNAVIFQFFISVKDRQSSITVCDLNNRLNSRSTFIDWNGALLGPIKDVQGLEQGGVSSSDYYKIFASEQLETAQKSSLGVKLGNLTVSAIGQADDTILISNDLYCLFLLLQLTNTFCSKYCVELTSDKTRLQAFIPKGHSFNDLQNK